MGGFCHIMRDKKNSENQRGMLDYLIFLLDDAKDFSWEGAKASHALLICRMEQGKIKGYTQTNKIDQIRRANAQRHPTQTILNSIPLERNSMLKLQKVCHVGFLTKAPVSIKKLIRRVVLCTNIYVPRVLMPGEKLFSSRNGVL